MQNFFELFISKNNRIARRQVKYFAAALLVCAAVIGLCFYALLRQQTIDLKQQEMKARAWRLSRAISSNLPALEQYYGDSISNSRFVNFLDDLTPELVWVVDSRRNLNMNMDSVRRRRAKHHAGAERSAQTRPLPQNSREAYAMLPEHIKSCVEKAFLGESSVAEDYNDFLQETVLTVVVPVKNSAGEIKAAVLLHAPVRGFDEAVWAAVKILAISFAVAFLVLLFLIFPMSWRLTESLNKMKVIAGRLADRDYTARCHISQDDEIGELANTLDVLSVRLELARQESQKLEKLRKEFIANISHELRTPVTVIRGSIEALQDGIITNPAAVAEYYGQIHQETLFLQRLINDLLDLSRLQNADFPIETEQLNLCDVINDAARGARQLCGDKGLRLVERLDTDVYVIEGDYGRLRQMLMIFLHNSVKFSKAGGSIEITLAGRELRLTDHGCGMRQEDIAHAFDRFYKQRNEQNKEGSGLGLAIAKQIALRHNMELRLESEPGSFTSVIITLPEKEQVEGC